MSCNLASASNPGSDPNGVEAFGIAGMHHVGFSTLDLDRLVRFYTETFGFEEEAAFSWEPGCDDIDAALALDESAGSMAMLRLGTVYLELFEFSNPRPAPADPARSVTQIGINHLCLLVDDIDVVVERLTSMSIPVHSSPRDIGDGPFVYCRDPDGNAIEFWQVSAANPEEEQ